MGELEKLLTVGELAERLNVSVGTVYHWTASRRIPFLKVGRRVAFDPGVVSAWLSERSRPHVPPRQRWRRERRRANQSVNRNTEAAVSAQEGAR